MRLMIDSRARRPVVRALVGVLGDYVLVQGRPEHEGRAADLAADPTVRDLFLGGKATPMLKSSNEGMGDGT